MMITKRTKAMRNVTCIILGIIMATAFFSMVIGQYVELRKNNTGSAVSENGVDWQSRYPVVEEYQSEDIVSQSPHHAEENVSSSRRTVFVRFRNLFTKIKNAAAGFEDNIILYRPLLELSGRFNRMLGKDSFIEKNGTVLLENGHLASIVQHGNEQEAINAEADELKSLADWLATIDCEFVYAQIPTKICRFDDSTVVSGDQTNEYYDEYIEALTFRGLNVLDLRDRLHEAGLNHYDLFYKTDAHWTLSAGRWASCEIAQELNDLFEWDVDYSPIESDDCFTEKRYKDWFLGYYGRKVTLGYAKPDDFSIYYPKCNTDIEVIAPDKDIQKRGQLQDVMYDYDILEVCNYYDNSSYETVGYGNRPLFVVKNRLAENDKKVLVIRNSFSLATIPFMSLVYGQCDWIDVRPTHGNFNGSLRTYIMETKPDVVILMYDILGYEFR